MCMMHIFCPPGLVCVFTVCVCVYGYTQTENRSDYSPSYSDLEI